MTVVLVTLLLMLASPAPAQQMACSGCSCRGGPGFRAEDGRCVAWKDLARKCGPPPHARCTDERPADLREAPSKKRSEPEEG